MTKARARSEAIRRFILAHVADHPRDIAAFTAAEFGVSRQAVHRHLASLVARGALVADGRTRGRTYRLRPEREHAFTLDVPGLDEADVWEERVLPLLPPLPDNVRSICNFGFTEMLNNVIDHSDSPTVEVRLIVDAARVTMELRDFGVGVFRKVIEAFGLKDARAAAVALAKGKYTTAAARHSGQGIFFTSRLFDRFLLASERSVWTAGTEGEVDFEATAPPLLGTRVRMVVSRFTARTLVDVFDRFAPESGGGAFSRTRIHVALMRKEGVDLVARSQAKRLMAGADRFAEVVLDFAGVPHVGQAFADEVFRVWQRGHPGVRLTCVEASPPVLRMVNRARRAAGLEPLGGAGPD